MEIRTGAKYNMSPAISREAPKDESALDATAPEIVNSIRAFTLREPADGIRDVAFDLTDEQAAALIASCAPSLGERNRDDV